MFVAKPTLTRALGAVILILFWTAATPSAVRAADGYPPGFRLQMRAERAANYVECWLTRGTLRCLSYHYSDSGCGCGGRIPTVAMRARGRAWRTWTCVDEGYHGWAWVQIGRTWRRGAFACRHQRRCRGTELRCRNSDHGFVIDASGRMRQ